jgi:peptidoglycan/LPS O-acetylase OafA/YrhL
MTAANPDLRFTALDGLRGLAVPFILAFALRADIADLNAPDAVQYLADGGYVLVDVFFVLAGFLLCRPLYAALAGAGGSRLFTDLARRIVPLHLAAWAITFGWLITGSSPGTLWDWASSALLLNGIAGPESAGYPASWSVSVAVWCALLLAATALATARASHRRRLPEIGPGRLVTGMALMAGLTGIALMVSSGPAAAGTVGPAAIGQALLGLGAGLLCFRVLEGGTGTLHPPRPGTAPAPRSAPGLGSLLALVALLFCLYRSDLMHELDLLPVFLVAAALVYFLAVPRHTGHSLVNRLLDARPLQWLGSRALALYLLHGPVQLTVERIGELSGLDRESVPVTYGVIAAVVLGSLVAADLGHRLLERTVAPPAPAPVAAVSMYRMPHSRPERIAQIDQQAIPSELRLRPLPRKATSAEIPGTPSAAAPSEPVRKLADKLAEKSAAKLPAGKAPSKTTRSPRSKPAAKATADKTADKATDPQTDAQVEKPPTKPIKLPADKPIKPSAAKPIKLPADDPIELPADKPARRTTARRPAKSVDQPIDLDQPADQLAAQARAVDQGDHSGSEDE